MSWFTLAFCSALLSAAAAVLQKRILYRMTAAGFSFAVSAIGVLLTLPLLQGTPTLPADAWTLLTAKSLLGAAAFLCVMSALRENQISRALPLLGLTPAVTALLSLFVVGESVHGWEWAGISLMLAGTWLVEARPRRERADAAPEGLVRSARFTVPAAILLMAVTAVADKVLLSGYKVAPATVLLYQQLVYCAVFGVLLAARRRGFRSLAAGWRAQLPLVAVVALLTAGYRLAQLEATREGPVALVLAVKRTSILYAAFFGGRLFSDDRLSPRLAGALLIVAAGFIVLRYLA